MAGQLLVARREGVEHGLRRGAAIPAEETFEVSARTAAALAVLAAAVVLAVLPASVALGVAPGLVAWAAVGTGGLVAAVGGVKVAAAAWVLVSRAVDASRSRGASAPIA